MIRSRSPAARPARASARAAATVESSSADTCDTRRSFIPVRDVIHSSFVSRKVERSAFVRTAGGMHAPQPVIAAKVMQGKLLAAQQFLQLLDDWSRREAGRGQGGDHAERGCDGQVP